MANSTTRQLAREIAKVISNDPEAAGMIREFISDGELFTKLGLIKKPLKVPTFWERVKAVFVVPQ